MSRTPGDWTLFSDGETNEIIGPDRIPVVKWPGFDDSFRSIGTHRANARFIVRACNSHDELLDALETLLDVVLNDNHGLTEALTKANNAIRKAKARVKTQ